MRQSISRWIVLAIIAGATSIVAAPVPALAEEPAPLATVGELGLTFETARFTANADRLAALEEIDRELANVSRGGLAAEERTAAQLLSGEIRYAVGDFKAAGEAFRRAAGDRGPFADDAAFAAILAMEADGRDAEAAKEWPKWEERFKDSPLRAEARLARIWNALRMGKTADAIKGAKELAAAHTWMASDRRLVLARGMALYLDGRAADALAALEPVTQASGPGAALTYLRALCHRTLGSTLKAAALFQEVSERYPDSPLCDPARLGKANIFLASRDYRSAAQEFKRVVGRAHDPKIRAEAELRSAAAVFLAGSPDSSLPLLSAVVESERGTHVAARAQFLIGEVRLTQGRHADAIVEFNRVLSEYFEHSVAASAQYRVARCFDALDRRNDATSAYQTVVSGYPLEPEAPAAAYLAGVGLLAQKKPLAAAPYFQLVLDRYAARQDSSGAVVFAAPQHRELVEAALCLLEYSYHQTGNLGQLSGAPHVLLSKMPPSRSPWRAYALLIDADASAAQGRYAEAQATLERLFREFPDHAVGAAANKLLAWTYAQQDRDDLAIATEERMVARYAVSGDVDALSSAYLNIAHSRFNQKRYADAAAAYEDFLHRFPAHPQHLTALYQAGLCYMRINRAGDAIDRWEAIVADSATAPVAERAWARAGDLYFQAERYENSKRCYQGLLSNFATSPAAAVAMLRLAQCEYNAGHDTAALEAFSAVTTRFPDHPAAKEAKRGTELALYRLGQSPRGAEELARLVEQHPESNFAADAQFQIGRRLYEQKQYGEAADSFRRVVSQFPGFSAVDRAQFLMADSYAQAGATTESRQAYEQFLSYFPESELKPTVAFRLAMLHFEAKDHMQAAVLFTGILEDSLTTEVASAALFNLAICQGLLRQPQEAVATLTRYRTKYPADSRKSQVAYQLGVLAEAAGQSGEAVAEFERALAANPPPALEVELDYRLGQCREQEGNVDQALRSYQKAVASPDKDDPFRLSAAARCAALYEERNEVSRAVAAYRDIARNSKDSELVSAAAGRASELEKGTGRRPAGSAPKAKANAADPEAAD
jgi:TolA-binding protein